MQAPSAGNTWLRVLLEVLVAAVIPIAATPIFTPFQQVAAGVLVYLVIAVTRIELRSSATAEQELVSQQLANAGGKVDSSLLSIQSSYRGILHSLPLEQNFISVILAQQIALLETRCRVAATQRELAATEDVYQRTTALLEAVAKCPSPVARLVLSLTPEAEGDGGQDDAWNRFYYRAQVDLVVHSNATIRRLFVTSPSTDLQAPVRERLLRFHALNRGFEGRFISLDAWRGLTHDLRLPDRSLDFGIWDELAVYKAVSTESDYLSGVYMTDSKVISSYRSIFDAAWAQAQPLESPKRNRWAKPMTLWELFEGAPPPPELAAAEAAVWRR